MVDPEYPIEQGLKEMSRLAIDYNYDADIESALQNGDFSQLRKILIQVGYPLQSVETSAPLYATLQIDPTDNHEGALIIIGLERELRQRNVNQLRASLKLYGHKVSLALAKKPTNVFNLDCP